MLFLRSTSWEATPTPASPKAHPPRILIRCSLISYVATPTKIPHPNMKRQPPLASSSKLPQLQTPPHLKDVRPISSRLHSSSVCALVNTQRQYPTNALYNSASKISSSMTNMSSFPKIPQTTSSFLPKPSPCFLTHRRTSSKGNHLPWRPPGSSMATQC